MSEMIERVAQAMRNRYAEGATPDADFPDPRMRVIWWLPYAEVAIAAMRIPTKVMLDEGWKYSALSASWDAMIDEALEE